MGSVCLAQKKNPHPSTRKDGDTLPLANSTDRRYSCVRLMIIVIVVAIPVLLGLPAMLVAVPPLMVRLPATLPFSVKVAPAVFGLTAVFAVVCDGAV